MLISRCYRCAVDGKILFEHLQMSLNGMAWNHLYFTRPEILDWRLGANLQT